MLRGTEVEINDKNFNISPNLQKVFNQTFNIPLKKIIDQEWETYKIILETLYFKNYTPKSRENKSGRYKTSKTIFRNNLGGQGIKKNYHTIWYNRYLHQTWKITRTKIIWSYWYSNRSQ